MSSILIHSRHIFSRSSDSGRKTIHSLLDRSPARLRSSWYNKPMRIRVSRCPHVFAAVLSGAFVLCLPLLRAAADPPRPIAQHRINEMAASLLRAHLALIEDPGLRFSGEHLDAYMERIAAPLPGEPEARYRVREESYVAAINQAADAENLCASFPALHDASAANVKLWQQAVKSSVHLGVRAAHVRAAWIACRQPGMGHEASKRLGIEMAQTVLVIKSAYEALRDAHP